MDFTNEPEPLTTHATAKKNQLLWIDWTTQVFDMERNSIQLIRSDFKEKKKTHKKIPKSSILRPK